MRYIYVHIYNTQFHLQLFFLTDSCSICMFVFIQEDSIAIVEKQTEMHILSCLFHAKIWKILSVWAGNLCLSWSEAESSAS